MKEQTQKANISEVRVAANSMLADCLPVSGGAPLPLTRHIGKIRDWLQDQNHPPLPVLPYDGGADQADRTMTGNFETLLSYYAKDGEIVDIFHDYILNIRRGIPWQGKFHRHEYVEIFYVAEGSFDQILLGRRYHFKQGDVVITDQNCTHADVIDGNEGTVLFLKVNPVYLDQLLNRIKGSEQFLHFLFHAILREEQTNSFLHLEPRDIPGKVSAMPGIMDSLFTENMVREAGYEDIIRGLLIRTFHELNEHYDLQLYSLGRENRERILLYEVEQYVRANLAEVVTEDLEERFHYHRNYFNLLIKKYHGMSFRNYVKSLRLESAANLLLHSGKPVRDIALETGYHNSSFFYQIFEGQYGMSPAEYRKQHADSVGFEST